MTKSICNQLQIKVGQFTLELDLVLRKIRNRKDAGAHQITPEVWKTRKFDDIRLRYCNSVHNQTTIDRWTKGCIFPFHKKGDLRITKNDRSIIFTSITAKIFNSLHLNSIEPKIAKILRKNQNDFQRKKTMTSQILIIRRLLGGVREKASKKLYYFCLPKGIWLYLQRKYGTHTSRLRSSQRNSRCHNYAI